MKMRFSFTKSFWICLICLTVLVLSIFKASPIWANYSQTIPSTQASVEAATITADKDNVKNKNTNNSLYDRLGGYNAIAKVIDDTAELLFNDRLIGRYFIGLSNDSKERLRQLLVDQFCEATGGPCIYTGRTMKVSHEGIGGGLSNTEFNAFVRYVSQALDRNGVRGREKREVLEFVNQQRGEIVGE